MIYHGSADAPQNSIEYLNMQRSHFGPGVADDFIQLYVVPNMGHCGSGDVPNDFGQWVRPNADVQTSMLKALEHWVEDSVRPRSIIATQWKRDGDTASGVLRTMALCPYPQRPGSDRQCH
jgi:feruloyl esterase